MSIFNRALKASQKRRIVQNPELASIFFRDLGINAIISRLHSIRNKKFPSCCYIGPLSQYFANSLSSSNFLSIKSLTILDCNKESLDYSLSQIPRDSAIKVVGLHLDEELWGFPQDYFDLIVNNLQLHWVNKVHEVAEKWLNSLRPDGALIGVALGGDSLQELRICLSLAEQEREGGISTHVSPMLHITDVGQVLIRLGYKLITVNTDINRLYFDDSFALMNFLQAIGENNAVFSRRSILSKESFIAADAIYRHLFAEKAGEFKGKIVATLELVHYIGWKDHPDQQQPLKPGTRGVDIKTLAEEIDDSDLEQYEIKDLDTGVEVNVVPKKNTNK